MSAEQLQDAGEVPRTCLPAAPLFQFAAKRDEDGGEFPIAIDRRVIQGRGSFFQARQEVQGIEEALALAVTTGVLGHRLALGCKYDAIHVALDRDRPESPAARHAVGVAVETHRLVLIDLTRLQNAGVERATRTRRRRESLALEASAHRLGVRAAGTLALGKAATQQVSVEFGEVGGARHGRRPTPLQVIDPILNARLLIALGRQTELRTQGVVAG